VEGGTCQRHARRSRNCRREIAIRYPFNMCSKKMEVSLAWGWRR
jgi:hypothetical protein